MNNINIILNEKEMPNFYKENALNYNPNQAYQPNMQNPWQTQG